MPDPVHIKVYRINQDGKYCVVISTDDEDLADRFYFTMLSNLDMATRKKNEVLYS